MYNSYFGNGVIIAPNVLAQGDKTTVLYKGLLYNSGADQVFIHSGFGKGWDNMADIKMEKNSEGFKAVLPMQNFGTLNMAFKDSAGNWDNNSGSNYSFEVQSR